MGNALTHYISDSAPRTLRLDHTAKFCGCKQKCLGKLISDIERMNKI